MRSLVSSNRLRCLSQVAFVSILAGMGAGCSSDFTRFDRNLYSALPASQSSAQNAYPGNVDQTTTASINGMPKPIGQVASPSVAPDDVGYQAAINQNPYPVRQPLPQATYQRAPVYNSGVVKAELPKTKFSAAPVKRLSARQVVDPVKTSAIKGVNDTSTKLTSAASNGVGGWSSTGGTAVQLKSGETLYNVSKRYGVPVREIMRANDIKNAGAVQAGQQIVIPTYVYSQSAPVSAPDNNPNTKAARASHGLLGQANASNVGVPTKRPQQLASIGSTQEEINPALKPRYHPKPRAKDESNSTPDYSVITGSVSGSKSGSLGGVYIVQSGDNLSRIASRNGVKTADLMRANGLSGSNIKIGQKLRIPNGSSSSIVASARQLPTKVDPITTGSVKKTGTPKKYVKPTVDKTVTNSTNTKAPAQTGIDKLRWPVSGRIVSSFGAKKGSSQNDGIDISVPEGTSVKAAENGVVIYSGSELEGFGNLILVRHADGFVTAYAHNKSNNVSKGANVKRGQVIAKSGKTGNASSPMLHFEVRKNSKPVNPVKYLGG